MFIRNNGLIPEKVDANTWELLIEGESALAERRFTIQSLRENFQIHTYQLTLECGGNGRSEFNPPASGNQWTVGAVACANWTGVRLKDVLNAVGINSDAKYVGYYGADLHLSKEPGKHPISRGIPIEKAMQDETLIAFEMNGKEIPMAHGFPLRLVAGGWPASASGKWINRLSIRNKIHDGAKMGGMSYRVPCHPVAPGSETKVEDMCIIESMPVKSLITSPKTGALITDSSSIAIQGHAWAGELGVQTVHFSIDFGATWKECKLEKPKNRLAWQHWNARVTFPQKGYYEIWAKATDENGTSQSMVLPGWNPRGYLNNACHRIAVKIV
jgi:DMSO/TMAO reductase YedYZ molybdopterin-dependent catalytic subunit